MLNLFQGGKVTSGLSDLQSEDSNCKGGDAAGSGMRRIGGDAGSKGDGICGNGDDNGRDPPPPPHHHGQRDNQLDPPLDPHHHPPSDPHLDQTQECIMVTQPWLRQQQAVAAPQLERHHPLVVYTLGTPTPVHKVCKRVRVVHALAPRGQARSPVE
nr:hypothetical protein [Tanacetum cinerariifolium]